MKDLKHNISSVKDTSTASMIAVREFIWILQGFNFLPITAFVFKLSAESYVKRETQLNDSFWLVQNAMPYLNAAKNVFPLLVFIVAVSATYRNVGRLTVCIWWNRQNKYLLRFSFVSVIYRWSFLCVFLFQPLVDFLTGQSRTRRNEREIWWY